MCEDSVLDLLVQGNVNSRSHHWYGTVKLSLRVNVRRMGTSRSERTLPACGPYRRVRVASRRACHLLESPALDRDPHPTPGRT
jgi:hypothetical protein